MKHKYNSKIVSISGYERWIYLQHDELLSPVYAHYIDEKYIEDNEKTTVDDNEMVEGELKIDLVSQYNVDNCKDNSGFIQPIYHSSHIIAFANIKDIVDEFTVVSEITGLHKEINIEFEKKIDFSIGDKVKVTGSLELDIE